MTMDTSAVRQTCLIFLTGPAQDSTPVNSAFPRCEISSSLVRKISPPTWTSPTDVSQVTSIAVAEMGDRLATIDVGETLEAVLLTGQDGTHVTQCALG